MECSFSSLVLLLLLGRVFRPNCKQKVSTRASFVVSLPQSVLKTLTGSDISLNPSISENSRLSWARENKKIVFGPNFYCIIQLPTPALLRSTEGFSASESTAY